MARYSAEDVAQLMEEDEHTICMEGSDDELGFDVTDSENSQGILVTATVSL